MKAFVLVSGGIDSMACIHFYKSHGYSVEAIFCDYGQPAREIERVSAMEVANYFSVPIHLIKTDGIRIPPSGEICGRNAMLAMQALCYVGNGCYKIIIGVHDGTKYFDCSSKFIDEINRVFDGYSNGTVIVEAPFVEWYKADIVSYCIQNKLPLNLTYSCESGTIPPCGKCKSCLDRRVLLHEKN